MHIISYISMLILHEDDFYHIQPIGLLYLSNFTEMK
uniref:Uncharacterized protein n=1 Tax=Anguilla anguilla TaxID=7936 RepID=A0A0E9R638_ANGAN